MRLCGHDCVVSGRYDCCFVGPGRYCAGLDPQNALNFGIILLDLLFNVRAGLIPPCRSHFAV